MRRYLLFGLYALIVAGLIVAIVLTFSSSSDDKDKPIAKQTAQSTANLPKTLGNNGNDKKPENKATSKPAQTPSTPAPTPAPDPTNQELSNTGPGTTVALFAGVVGVGIVGYQIRLRRKVSL